MKLADYVSVMFSEPGLSVCGPEALSRPIGSYKLYISTSLQKGRTWECQRHLDDVGPRVESGPL